MKISKRAQLAELADAVDQHAMDLTQAAFDYERRADENDLVRQVQTFNALVTALDEYGTYLAKRLGVTLW